MSFLPQEFKDFIAPNADRCSIICTYLKNNGVDSAIAAIDGKNHILVQFASQAYNPQFRIKTVIAHYDRVDGSPGANDNSAAVWQIMNWATEEYAKNGSIFGAGKLFISNFNNLYERSQDLLRRACPGRWMSLPVPYSDNASFLACGIPAVAITMLPAEEASLYARELNKNKNLVDAVMNRETSKKARMAGQQTDYSYKERMPRTWKLFHTPQDNEDSLSPESFRIMHNILVTLAELKSM